MRKERSIKNVITSLISNIIVLLFGFITQKVFINTLGDEYLGLNSLLSNIVSMLAIVELGIGSAIIYSLYEPIAKNNKEKIKSLLKFYKKTYNRIAFIVFILGLCLLPFLHFIVSTTLDVNIYLIFMLFVIDVVFSYLLSYKRSILQADQRSDVINLIHIIYTVILNIGLILVLYGTNNYILYLIIKCLCRSFENIVISIFADKMYSYIKEESVNLDKKTYSSIVKKVKGLLFHKIGSFIVLGTDNIIISKYLGNVIVAYYSNYYLIINAASTLLSQVFSALTASVGNLLVEDNKEKSYSLFRKLMFFNFWLYSFAGIGLFLAITPFISMWVGNERVLPISVLIVLVINFYMMGMRSSIGVYKDAAGIFYEDRFIPLLESLLNIIFSLILVKPFGLLGVFIGTMISSFVVVFFSLPYFVYKNVFKNKMIDYYKMYFKYIGLTIFVGIISYYLYSFIVMGIDINSYILQLIIAILVAVLMPNLIYLLIFHKTEEYKYFFDIGLNIFKKIFKYNTNKKKTLF